MRYLFILNDPAYGTERSYNGPRLAMTLAKLEGASVSVFLIGDAVTSAFLPAVCATKWEYRLCGAHALEICPKAKCWCSQSFKVRSQWWLHLW